MVNITDLKVGDKVRALADLISPADDYAPASCYAKKGDILVIRKIHQSAIQYNVSVSHEDVLDSTFGLSCDEIEMVEAVPMPSNGG